MSALSFAPQKALRNPPKIPKMSHADPDSPSPPFGRDWFFPSPSPYCAHSSPAKTPKYPRRFSTNPRASYSSASSSSRSLDSRLAPRPPPPPPPPQPPTFRSAPPVNSAPYREARYAGGRRRFVPSLRSERLLVGGEKKAVSSRDGGASSAGLDQKPEALAEKVPSRAHGIGDLRTRLRLRLRWRMALLVAVRLLRARAS